MASLDFEVILVGVFVTSFVLKMPSNSHMMLV